MVLKVCWMAERQARNYYFIIYLNIFKNLPAEVNLSIHIFFTCISSSIATLTIWKCNNYYLFSQHRKIFFALKYVHTKTPADLCLDFYVLNIFLTSNLTTPKLSLISHKRYKRYYSTHILILKLHLTQKRYAESS